MRLDPAEIEPGLVVFCDPAVLAADPGTSATDYAENCVQGPHFFVVLRRHDSGRWLLTPAFSRTTLERVQLDQSCKWGPSTGWVQKPSYVYRWEHWLVPTQALIEASAADKTSIGRRNSYALRAPTTLANLARFFDDNARPLINLVSGELADL